MRTCRIMRVAQIEAFKLEPDSCLNSIMRFFARKSKSSTIIIDNGKNFVRAQGEFAEYVAAWNKEGI